MKVLKFGGTSVGSVNSILSLKRIVEKAAREQQVIVVVSALGGITDKLLLTSQLAVKGDINYALELELMMKRHYDMIDAIISDPGQKSLLTAKVRTLFDELKSLYYGVYLIHDLSDRTQDTIVSYGERLSSLIVAALVNDAVWYDSREFIKTTYKGGKNLLDSEMTMRLVRDTFAQVPQVAIVPGFISRDSDTGEVTNLGRGGSDYTAAIIAAALDANVLEIWTDVNGFMTADPRVIPGAYTINELSYVEATELCNFGAKVIYPPTIYPVCVKNIPILVKNTFNPNNPGTIIKKDIANDNKAIKGISSISATSIITVSGLSMVGVIGVNQRIFSVLADNGISVFMVCQASSENSTSIAVRDADSKKAVKVLNQEFAKEIETGAMYSMHAENGLATVAIVGENMRHTPGIAGKLFGTLGRSGISITACSQGAFGTNISFVIDGRLLNKALNVIHDSFFLSEYNVLNLFICGVGSVGSKLIEQIRSQYDTLKRSRHLKLNVVGIANSKHAVFDPEGLDLDNYRELLAKGEKTSPEKLLQDVIGMNLFNSVFVDCTASQAVADMYLPLLESNVSVVAANKIAASSAYDNYAQLKSAALARGVKFRFETNVGAGLPIISTINDLLNSGDKILKIEAVLSGTLNYIFNEISAEVPFSEAVRRAVAAGYSEPDPRIDVTGTDVVRKLVILTREAGYRIDQEEVDNQVLVPRDIIEGSIDEFWDRLPSVDQHFEAERRKVHDNGQHWRVVATMEHGRARVELKAIDKNHPFYNLEGSTNIVLLTTDRYNEYPMQIKGYGAGASVTAAGVFANIMSIANI